MTPAFGTDGIRGVANTELTPELALSLGRAAARHLPGGAFLVGRDTRRSGPLLQAALAAGLASEGADVVDVGVLPTPGIAWLAASRHLPAAMISASHNPFDDNGIKLLSDAGTKLPDALERAIEDELATLAAGDAAPDDGPPPSGAAVGHIAPEPDAVDGYVDHLVSTVGGRAGPLATSGLKVVVDCANGAASAIAPVVFARLGVDATIVHASPDGLNINAACGSTHLEHLAGAVVAAGADLGVAFDGDADRVLAVDHLGRLVDGDQLLCMFALDLDERHELSDRSIVVTVMSNLGLHRALRSRGITVVETPVGDRHVADALEANGLVLGGEQSGHVVFAREATTGDGVLTALKLLELLARRHASLADLASGAMSRLPQLLRSVRVGAPDRLPEARGVWQAVDEASASLGDAGRILLRASGTEPLVRVMVEAETEQLASEIAGRLVDLVLAELGAPF